MKIFCTFLLALTCSFSCLSALSHGMTSKQVRKEIGKAESTLAMGNKEVLIYPNGDKLVFLDGGLDSVNGTPLPRSNTAPVKAPTPAPQANAAPTVTEHLLGEPVHKDPVVRHDQNIAETIQESAPAINENGDEFSYGEYMNNFDGSVDGFQESMDAYEEEHHVKDPPTLQERALGLGLGFIAEIIITLIVLKIAFEIVGFPCLWRQLFILSITVALGSLLVSFAFAGGLFNPVRNGLAFIIMLLMIPKLTDVREWPTAIAIAITARVVSIVLMWLVFGVLMMAIGSFV